MSRNSELRVVDPVLTNLVRGYSNTEFVAENLFPIVGVDKEAGKIPLFGKDAFKVFVTERALRANSNKIQPEARTTADFVLTEHDAVYPMDYREISEDILSLETYAAFRAQAAIQLRHEKACADLAIATGSYTNNNYATLTSTDQWTHADSKPLVHISTGIEKIRNLTGKRPNVMLMGAAAFKTLKDHSTIQDRIKYSQLGVATAALIAALTGISKVVIGDGVYANDAMTTVYDIWGDNVILAYVPEAQGGQRSQYEPSFGYTLRKKGFPEIDKYDEVGGKIQNVRSTDLFVPKIVGNDAGYLINDVNA
jgi:hypothetical protein